MRRQIPGHYVSIKLRMNKMIYAGSYIQNNEQIEAELFNGYQNRSSAKDTDTKNPAEAGWFFNYL